MMEASKSLKSGKNLTTAEEPQVIIHYAEHGPSLESCMISILSLHISK